MARIDLSARTKAASVPLIRGEPSWRKVARVLCVWASKIARTVAAKSGAA